ARCAPGFGIADAYGAWSLYMRSWPWAPGKLCMWRMDQKIFGATWDTGIGAESVGGRWNPRGYAAVYCSVDPATAILQVALHKGLNALSRVPIVRTCAKIHDPGSLHVMNEVELPNANGLSPGIPGHAQQHFGRALLEKPPFVAIKSAFCPQSWIVVFTPAAAT